MLTAIGLFYGPRLHPGLTRRGMTAPTLILYQRDDCHLCDLALDVLAAAGVPEFKSVFIDDDGALEARYGSRVPVLRTDDGRELDWPFDVEVLRGLLR